MDATSRIKTLANSLNDLSLESKTGIILGVTFFFSLFLSLFFVIGPAVKADYAVSGGSDAYYNMRIVQFILSTHHQLLFDPSLNYPIGLENPRPPFFHWLIVLLGYAFSPFLGGVYKSTMTMFLASTAIGGAFIVFPTYYLGKELFGYKVGLVAAVLVAMSPLTLMKSIGTIGLFDIYTALFSLMFIYYFLRAVNTFKYEGNETKLLPSLVQSVKSNPISITYALLAAVSLAATMLTWVGAISLILLLVGAAVIQLAIYALKKKSALSIFVTNLVFGFGFLVAFPWYYVAHFIPIRFDYPFILWGVLVLVSLYFLIMRRRPWLVSIGVLVVAAVVGVLLLAKFDNTFLYAILSGQHYFVKNKIYDTIAEAQALPLGEDLLEFGAFSFFAAFIGLAYLVYKWIRTATFSMTLAVIYFGGIIIISMIASKFLYFGATAASILTAYIIVRAFELLEFREAIEKSKGRSVRNALRREFRFAHYATILIVVFLLIVPTTFYAVDSAIPYNNKTAYDRQLYNDTPTFLRPTNYSAPYYLGAFGASLATPQQPWGRALSWFQNQDANQSPNNRPGFISWWDYGFQTLEQGNHPVMADNFQDGIYPAAQILLAQNESEIISVMIAQMIYNYSLAGDINNTSLLRILDQYLGPSGTSNVVYFEENPLSIPHQDSIKAQIKANPNFYGNHSSTIQGGDALYIAMEHYLTNTYPLNTLINIYSAIEQLSSKRMSYISVDYGLFPFNGTNTGIFYAPSYLGDFPYVNASGEIIPSEFYTINVTSTNGVTYALQNFPSGATAASYSISYTPAFYNSTIYRGFIGYPPSAIGASSGIPGYSSNLTSYPAMQGWGMANFELSYKTILWNPYTDYKNHSNAWKEIPLNEGYSFMQKHYGTVDLFPPASVLSSDVIFLHYYPGAIISGQVTNTKGEPVQGVRVTLTDQYGIPHESVLTNSTGYYSLYAVAGNDTVTYSTGSVNELYMLGNKTLSFYNVSISNAQANRVSYNQYGIPTWNITHNLVVNSTQINGIVFLNLAKSKSFTSIDQTLNGTVRYYNSTYNITYTTHTLKNGSYQISNVQPYTYRISVYVDGQWYNNVASVTASSKTLSKDVPLDYGIMNASLQSGVTLTPGANITFSRGNFSTTYGLNEADQAYYLPTGIYNVSAQSGGMWTNFTAQLTNNSTANLNLAFSTSYKITFITEIGGSRVSAPIVINNATYVAASTRTIMSNSNGVANYGAPQSALSVYSDIYYNGNYYTATDILNVSGPMTVFLNLQKSYLISGQYRVNGTGQNNTNIAITGPKAYVELFGNASGYFSTYLPAGQYSIVTYSHYDFRLYVGAESFTVSNQNVYLTLNGYHGYQVNGTVKFGKASVGGLVTTQLNGQPYFDYFSKKGGSYLLYLQDGQSISNISFISPGYSILTSTSAQINLKVLPVNVSIDASYSGSVPLTLYLNGSQEYVVRGTHYFNLSMIPGSYSVAFSRQDTNITTSSKSIAVVAGGANQTYSLNLFIKAKLYVDPAQHIYIFQNGNLVSTNLNNTLQIGNYTIYAYNGTRAALERVNLTGNYNVTLNFQASYNVTLVTSPAVNVTINSAAGLITWQHYILLPKGTYTFTIDKNYNTSYVYFASSSVYISSSRTVSLNGTLREVLSNVTVGYYYNGHALTTGNFYLQGPKNVSGTLSAGTMSIPVGNYSIYVTSGNLAYFGGFEVSTSSESFNFTLQRAYPLDYGTFLNNTSYTGMVALQSNANYYLPPSGVINLPNGSYTFKALTTYTYYGYLDNYSIYQSVKVSGVSSATLAFKINSEERVIFDAEAGNPVLKTGQSITFPLLITSKANIPLNFTIGNSSTFYVNGTGINLAPFSSGETYVTLKVPAHESAGYTSVYIRVYYGDTYSNIQVNVTVAQVQNISASVNTNTGSITGNLMKIQMTVYNTGNVKTEVNATILNSAQLKADGIAVTFSNSSSFSKKLGADSNNSTYLLINSTTGKSLAGTVVTILLSYGNTTKIVTAKLATPSLKVSNGTGAGKTISAYSPLTQDYYIYAFVAFIVLAMLVVMLIFRRRFRS